MDNKNSNLPQGVITSDKVNPQNNPVGEKKVKIKIPKVNKKTIVIAAVAVLVIFVIFCFFKSGKVSNIFGGGNKEEEDKVIEVDVSTEWGKAYALEAQKLYKEKEIDHFDMAFINLDDFNEPEMIIKFTDENEKEYTRIYHIDSTSKQVQVSKEFSNAEIKYIYSLLDGDSFFYLNIKRDNKYGTYTLCSKIVAGTVVAPDISATNEKQLNQFADNYVVANYSIVYYEVKKDNYAENFRTMHDRYDKYSEEIFDLKYEMKDKYQKDNKKIIDEKPYLVTGNYHLTYGDYSHVPSIGADGKEVDSSFAGTTITLKNDGTVIVKGFTYKYTVTGNVLNLNNGSTITVKDFDFFVISDDGGNNFKCNNPYVDPQAENKQDQNNTNQEGNNNSNQEDPNKQSDNNSQKENENNNNE